MKSRSRQGGRGLLQHAWATDQTAVKPPKELAFRSFSGNQRRGTGVPDSPAALPTATRRMLSPSCYPPVSSKRVPGSSGPLGSHRGQPRLLAAGHGNARENGMTSYNCEEEM